jgi:hypothetical protein
MNVAPDFYPLESFISEVSLEVTVPGFVELIIVEVKYAFITIIFLFFF